MQNLRYFKKHHHRTAILQYYFNLLEIFSISGYYAQPHCSATKLNGRSVSAPPVLTF
jgi:hypothetical protein